MYNDNEYLIDNVGFTDPRGNSSQEYDDYPAVRDCAFCGYTFVQGTGYINNDNYCSSECYHDACNTN